MRFLLPCLIPDLITLRLKNLMMCRPTRSPIFYQQMRGRGSRLCEGIGKREYLIYDFVGNAEYFNDEGYDPF